MPYAREPATRSRVFYCLPGGTKEKEMVFIKKEITFMNKNILTKITAIALSLSFAGSLAACSKANADTAEEGTVIRVGANITPHSEILEQAKPILAEQGITLEIVQIEDSITPNTGVIEGSLDANYFQHVPYLDQFNL